VVITKVFTDTESRLSNRQRAERSPSTEATARWALVVRREASGPAGRIVSERECKGPQHPNSAPVTPEQAESAPGTHARAVRATTHWLLHQ